MMLRLLPLRNQALVAIRLIEFLCSAKGAISNQPGASPQEFKSPGKWALKARFSWPMDSHCCPKWIARAFSAGVFGSPVILGRCPRLWHERRAFGVQHIPAWLLARRLVSI